MAKFLKIRECAYRESGCMLRVCLTLLWMACCQVAMAQGLGSGLVVVVNPESLETELLNSGAEPFAFGGYQIRCTTGCLSPTGWTSIDDQFNSEVPSVVTQIKQKLGNRGSLGEVPNISAEFLSELTATVSPILKPGDSVGIGKPFAGPFSALSGLVQGGQLRVTFAKEVSTGQFAQVDVPVVPEPSTLCLAGLSAVALTGWMLRRR